MSTLPHRFSRLKPSIWRETPLLSRISSLCHLAPRGRQLPAEMQLEALPCAHMVASRLATCSAPLLPWEHANRSYQHATLLCTLSPVTMTALNEDSKERSAPDVHSWTDQGPLL